MMTRSRIEIVARCLVALSLVLLLGARAGWCRPSGADGSVEFTAEEKAFLAGHAPIRVGIMSNWPPLDYVDEGGRPAGIGHDYLRALNGLLGDVLVAEPAPFSENYEKVKEGRMDALMDITPREDREPFFEFTRPYLSVPHVIIGRKDGLYFSSEEALKGKTVALEKGYYNVVVFRENFPDVQIREYGSTSDALDAVARGEADAYAGNRAVAIYLIEKELLGNLQPQGRLNTPPIDLAIGVRKDRPMLAAILDRALKAIPAGERDKINARYVSSVYEPWFASRYFWTVVAASLGAVLLVGLLGMLWTRTLKRMVETRTRQFIREHKERLRAEESLGESERRYLTLFENAGDAIFLMSRDRFVECNARALALFGCNQQDIIGASPYRFSPELQPDGRASGEKALEMIDRALTEGAQFFEWVHCRMDGEPFDAEVMLNRLDLGREVFLQAVVRDITERKRSQEQLKEYSQNLERMVEDRTRELDEARAEMFSQAKLSAMGRMGAGLAHQLNSPLGGATLIVDGLMESLGKDSEHKEALRHVRTALDNMHNIVECMLTLSMLPKRGRVSRASVDLSKAIDSILNLALHDCTGRGIEISRRLAERLPMITARPGELDQIFLNLVNNAVDAMPSGGTLTVETGEADGVVEVRVADTGEGIKPENLERIFEPFFTTRRARRGVGLGLSVVREMVERYGGTITVQSKLGKGTTFTVRIPASGLKDEETPSEK